VQAAVQARRRQTDLTVQQIPATVVRVVNLIRLTLLKAETADQVLLSCIIDTTKYQNIDKYIIHS
jgi:hypothetical protein